MHLRRTTAFVAILAVAAGLVPALAAPPAVAEDPTGPQASITTDGGLLTLDLGNQPESGAPAASSATASSSDGIPDAHGDWPTGNRDRARTGNAAWEEFRLS